MKVFVDTNIFLDFILGRRGVQLADLQSFEEAAKDKFSLIVPHILIDEVYRGIPQSPKEKKIKKKNEENENFLFGMPEGLPATLQSSDDYKKTMQAIGVISKNLPLLERQIQQGLDQMLTDHIEKLLVPTEDKAEEEELIKKAELRKLKGNPPGKRSDPLGDNIVWEIILAKYCNDDVIIIAGDGDWGYLSNDNNNPSAIHTFLQREWDATKTEKKIALFSSIRAFLRSLEPKGVEGETKTEEAPPTIPLPISLGSQPWITGVANIAPASNVSLGSIQPTFFVERVVCANCGRALPGSNTYTLGSLSPQYITCPYCGHVNPI